jgi:prepilin-type N-terminal cleavage/methylation domain-containing protein
MSGRTHRVTRPRERDERGMTLTELLVAMAVFGIVLVGVAALTLGIQRSDRAARDRVDDTEEGRFALQQLSRTVGRAVVPTALGGRERSAFAEIEPGRLVLYADLDNPGNSVGPSRVEHVLDGGVLTQTVRVPVEGTRDTYCEDGDDAPGCEGRVTTHVLARAVVASDDDPVFTYLDAAGDPTDEPRLVRAVQVSLAVQHDTGSGDEPARFGDRIVPSAVNP